MVGLTEDRTRAKNRYRVAVESLRLSAKKSDGDADLYKRSVEQLGVDELTHFDLVSIGRHHQWPITHGDSFFRKIVERRRLRQLGPIPERHIGAKNADLKLAQDLGVAVPKSLWTGKIADIPANLRHDTFLKPTQSSGSKGAFHLFRDDDIFSVCSSERIGGWKEMLEAARSQMVPADINAVTWEVQELIKDGSSRPARDMKFYGFYGQIGLIVEVSRHPNTEYEFFNEDGSVAACGVDHAPRFLDPADATTDKGGLSEAKLETVRKLSLALPMPFMRIDFLNGADELVFCEFSSAPGRSHTFNREYDQILGRMYNQASLRLTNDLLKGKTFDAFQAWASKPS